MTTMPGDVTFGKVVGRLLIVTEDGVDPGSEPDAVAPTGLIVTFTPRFSPFKTDPPVAQVSVGPVTASVDEEGYLIDDQDEPGVWLVTGDWWVTYSGPYSETFSHRYSGGRHDIRVLAAHTEIDPLDLGEAAPSGTPLLPSQFADLKAQIDALAVAAGVTVHGDLTDLDEDDHPQYALADGSRGDFASDADLAAHAADTTAIHGIADTAALVVTTDPRLSDARTPTAHNHDDRYFTEAEVTASLAGKADLAHPHTSAQITDFAEAAQDAIAALLAGASGVTLNYDDVAATLTISGGGGGGLDEEAVRDAIGVALIGSGLITVTVNDGLDTITISTTATANSTDAALRDRSLHTGEQAISTITALQAALDAKADDLGPDDNYVTDAEKVVIGDTSGFNTGDQVLPDWDTIGNKPAVISAGATMAAARTAIGLGTAATAATGDFATAAQGTKADTALQPATGQTINAQTGTTYTPVAGDAGKIVTANNASPITVTAPPNVFTAGQRVDFIVIGAGMVTVVPGAAVTVNGTPSLVSRAQYSAFTLICLTATTFVVVGDLA